MTTVSEAYALSSYFTPILSHFMVDISLASLGFGFYVGGD